MKQNGNLTAPCFLHFQKRTPALWQNLYPLQAQTDLVTEASLIWPFYQIEIRLSVRAEHALRYWQAHNGPGITVKVPYILLKPVTSVVYTACTNSSHILKAGQKSGNTLP